MRARFGLLLAVLAAQVGCSTSEQKTGTERDVPFYCAGGGTSIRLDSAPAVLVRNDPVDIVITWELSEHASEPATATLTAGADNELEVVLPLSLDSAEPGIVYSATQLNPFGSAAPAGTVTVLASGAASEGCLAPATATTTFELQ